MWPFRRREIPQDSAQRHRATLDLIEQVAALRGQVRSLESEWDDMRAQIRKGYQRMEKAFERLDSSPPEEVTPEIGAPEHIEGPGNRFLEKMRAMKPA